MSDEVYVLISGVPSHQGTVRWRRHMSGPLAFCEEWKAKLPSLGRTPDSGQTNMGKLDIITLERWNELKSQGLV